MGHEDSSATGRSPLTCCNVLAINFCKVDNMSTVKEMVGRQVSFLSSEQRAVTFEYPARIEISSVYLQVKDEGSRYCVISGH
jgi:hypothetical protein